MVGLQSIVAVSSPSSILTKQIWKARAGRVSSASDSTVKRSVPSSSCCTAKRVSSLRDPLCSTRRKRAVSREHLNVQFFRQCAGVVQPPVQRQNRAVLREHRDASAIPHHFNRPPAAISNVRKDVRPAAFRQPDVRRSKPVRFRRVHDGVKRSADPRINIDRRIRRPSVLPASGKYMGRDQRASRFACQHRTRVEKRNQPPPKLKPARRCEPRGQRIRPWLLCRHLGRAVMNAVDRAEHAELQPSQVQLSRSARLCDAPPISWLHQV